MTVGRTNEEVASLLRELATLTELEEGSPQAFRVRAYDNGVRAVEGLTRDVAEMSEEELAEIKGIGASIAAKIREYVDAGTIDKLERMRDEFPRGQVELLRVPGVGAKTVRLLEDELGIVDVAGLRDAVEQQRLRDLPGLGAKTEDNIRQALERLDLGQPHQRTPIHRVLPVARRIVTDLEQDGHAEAIRIAGSLRRFRHTIGDVDILVATSTPEPAMTAFVDRPEVDEVIARGETKTSVVTRDRLQIDLRAVRPEQFGAALVYFTGSKAHNIRLRERALARDLTLNEYGLFPVGEEDEEAVAGATEHDVYRALDLPWIPPELREDDGEIELADDGALPELVEPEDLAGDLHDHTDASGDGRMSLEQLIAAAEERGLAYLAVTDHAENLSINGIDRDAMLAQRDRLRALQGDHPDLRLLHGAELNIGRDGTLDYDPEFLTGFDWCVASVHSHFNLGVDEQTDRVVAAIRNPAVGAIGHLTGRQIGSRPGIELDVERVLEAAAETGTALEINGNLRRLDAPVEVVREGAARGVHFVISSDAHTVAELAHLEHGVRHARRGRLPRRLVVNTWEPDAFLDWVATVTQAA